MLLLLIFQNARSSVFRTQPFFRRLLDGFVQNGLSELYEECCSELNRSGLYWLRKFFSLPNVIL